MAKVEGGGGLAAIVIALITAASAVIVAMIGSKVGPFAENPLPVETPGVPAVGAAASSTLRESPAVAAAPSGGEVAPSDEGAAEVPDTDPGELEDLSSETLNLSAEPFSGTVSLSAGFESDPRVVEVVAGGTSAAATIPDGGCSGYVSAAPDVRLHYEAGSAPLIISVASEADTTLVINSPGGWHCDDDSGDAGGNPSLSFEAPDSGAYEIWVGTFAAGDNQPARLHISEIGSQ